MVVHFCYLWVRVFLLHSKDGMDMDWNPANHSKNCDSKDFFKVKKESNQSHSYFELVVLLFSEKE